MSEADNKDLTLLEIETVSDAISTIIEHIEQVTEPVADLLDEVATVSSPLAEALNVIKTLNKIADIPNKIFMKKLEKYLRGLAEIPESKRKKYAEKVGKPGLNKDSVFILNIINKIEEESKIIILVKLFEAKMDESIDDNTYRRLTLLVDHTMYSDLVYLKNNITDDEVEIDNDAKQGLLCNGWLTYFNQTWGSATKGSRQIYKYNDIAKNFCQLINT